MDNDLEDLRNEARRITWWIGLYKKGWWGRACCRMYYWWLSFLGSPLPFSWASYEGVAVGQEETLVHSSGYEDEAIDWFLTKKVLLNGERINAVQFIEEYDLGGGDHSKVKTKFRPRWVKW